MKIDYTSRARIACFDGDASQLPSQLPGLPAAPAEPKMISQEEVNRILADDRRKHSAKVQAAERALSDALESRNLTVRERDEMTQRLEELQASQRTRAEQEAHEKKQAAEKHAKELATTQKQAAEWKTKYESAMIDGAIVSAGNSAEVFSTAQFAALMRGRAKMQTVEDGDGKREEVFLDFDDVDAESGRTYTASRPVAVAIRRMKELPNLYGNLFKSGVVSGAGGQSGAGGIGPGGKIDVRNLTPQQYAKIRAENPEWLGLRRDKKRTI
jgi:hypothetical protein